MKKIVIFGPQGSGKGTQAELLSQRFHMVHLSMGEMLRYEIQHKTVLGKIAQKYVISGKLVPDPIIFKIIKRHIFDKEAKKNGFILDGYPRNQRQQKDLESIIKITDVLVIEITDKEAVARLSGRLTCPCGRIYHLKHRPPKKRGQCDFCGQKLYVRQDDTPKVLRRRLKIYREQTAPIIAEYEKQGIVKRVDGTPSIPEVFAQLTKALG